MGNASGVKDKTLRRFAAGAVLGIPVDEITVNIFKLFIWDAGREVGFDVRPCIAQEAWSNCFPKVVFNPLDDLACGVVVINQRTLI